MQSSVYFCILLWVSPALNATWDWKNLWNQLFFWRVGRLNSEPIPKGCISQWHAQEMAKEALKGDLPWPHASQLCWKLFEQSSIWQIWLTFFSSMSTDGHSTARSIFNFRMHAIYLMVQSLFVPRAQLGEATFCYVAFMHSENVEMVEESCLGLLRSLAAKMMCRIHVTHGPWRELGWDREGSSNATGMLALLQDQVRNLSF